MKDSLELIYQTYLTGNSEASSELPMIVPLHFMGSNPEQTFEMFLGGFDTPARVIIPCGPYPHKGQYSWFPANLYKESDQDQGKFIDSNVEMLLENVSLWKKKYPTHGKPIYLGISQGGDMCFTLAAKYSDQFELCIPAAGRLFAEEITKKRDSGKIRIHQGEADLIVSVESARQAAKRLSLAKFDVEIQEYEGVGHGVNAEMSKAIQADINTVLEP